MSDLNCFFSDPNGLSFQLNVKSESSPLDADHAVAALALVDEWIAEHDND